MVKPPALPDVDTVLQVIENNHYHLQKSSVELKVSPSTLTRFLRKHGLRQQWRTNKNENSPTPLEKKTSHNLRNDLAAAHLELDKLRKIIGKMTDVELKEPKWLAKPVKASGKTVPVLFTSDFQWGEVVKRDEVNGLNAFNKEIGKSRYQLLIEKALLLGGGSPEGLVLLRGGDSISGDIHEELLRTNDLSSMEAVLSLAELEVAGIRRLQQHFKKVLVISVPGNHGRTTHKPMSKGYSIHSYDSLLTHLIASHLQGEKGIQFHHPASGDAYFSIFGQRFLLTHGDRIGSRGGQGFVGPAATILRGAHRVRQQYSQIGKPIDWLLLGHFHTPMMLPHVIVNGTLVGFSEYAHTLRVEPNPPQQTMFHVHSEYGLTAYLPIYLESFENKPEAGTIKLWD